ncbi:autotransporter domain-containing protein [Akkermansia sp.]|uniref:autotransporter family protein n=1 Tax=Akkermansia sp. TaxID=1872421 RepID=UPI0025B97DFB|nr:autotransporter domain-containing protein [Akkermansia sp.]MCC8148606.1 autotransporter domain-containing protein [Akkermansia sp.]
MKLRLPQVLLAAVIACLGSFSVATAADYPVDSADSLVTAWNQAAASNEASTITITLPPGEDSLTLTQEQRVQMQAISGTGNITIQMADPSGKLINFNYDLVNDQVSFNDITLSEPLGSDNDIVVTHATNTDTIDGRNVAIMGTDDAAHPKTIGALITSTNGQVGIGDNVSMEKAITVNDQATKTVDPQTPPAGQAYTRTTYSTYNDSNEQAVVLGNNVTMQSTVTATGQIVSDPASKITLNGDVTSTAGIGNVTTEEFDASNTQTSKTVIDSLDDSVSGGIVLGETTAGAINIKTQGGNVSLGDNTVLNGTTVSAESVDLNKTVYSNDDGNWNTVANTERLDTIEGSITLGNNSTVKGNATLTADDNIAIGNNSVITGNTAADGIVTAGGQISIGDGTQVVDNTATNADKAAINLAESQTLYIGSGAVLSGNTANGVAGSVHAGQNSQINVYTDATAYTYINDGIATAAPATVNDKAAVMTKTGAGTLVYGGTTGADTFGGTYKQLEGNLVIGRATFGTANAAAERAATAPAIGSATMGTDDTVYDIQTGSVTLAQGSTMKGASATFGGDSTLLLSDGSVLDFGTPATFKDDSRVGIQVSDATGSPVPLAQLKKGTESVTVTLNGTDISGRLLNNLFLSTTMAPGTADGTTTITQNMKGIDGPLSGYNGNVYTVAAALENNRLNVAAGTPAAQFYETLLRSTNADEAASLIQSVSGEHVVNFTWAASRTVRNFADLGRIQSAASMARQTEDTIEVVDAKGSPIARKTIAKGNGNIWVGGMGIWDDQDARDGVSGYKYNVGGYAVGIDYKAAQGSLIGIAAGQSFGDFKDKTGIGADYDVDSFLAMIYGRMHPFRDSKFTLDGYGAYGRSRFKGDSYMMGSAANGRADTDTFSGGLYGTWTERFALGRAFVTPYTGIEFMTSELKGFSESGPYGRTFGHARAQNWTIPVGITIARTYQTDGGTSITPALTVAAAQDVSRMNPKSNVSGPLGDWNARGVNVGRTAFRLNAGIDVLFSSNWGARICYQFETRNKLTAHGINGAISYTF